MRELCWSWLGRISYDDAHAQQLLIREAVAAGRELSTLLVLEHEPVITLGRRGQADDLLVSASDLAPRGLVLRHAERGGRATYHGPGQLVGYLIAKARNLAPDLPTLVLRIEEALLDVCAELGIEGRRHPQHRGIWVGPAKVGFVGLAVSRGITWHGLALNLTPDLSAFDVIRPCGLDDPITSLMAAGAQETTPQQLAALLARELAQAFALRPVEWSSARPPIVLRNEAHLEHMRPQFSGDQKHFTLGHVGDPVQHVGGGPF